MVFVEKLGGRGISETVRGHSFLSCDRDFGSIKRVVRKEDIVDTPEG